MMDPPPLKVPSTPVMPLFPLSPERVNGTRPPYGASIPQSLSLPDFGMKGTVEPSVLLKGAGSANSSPYRHSRNNSEALVQGMVARFDSLSIKDFRQRDEVLLKRLEMSKEFAELEKDKAREKLQESEEQARKWREDARKLKKELEDGKERERKLTRRAEVAKEEVDKIKAAYDHHVGVFEKEIKRARKEAFKSSSALVKTQEELKSARSSLAVAKQQLELEKSKSSRYEQDAFSSQYKLVGTQEELQKALEKIKLVEEERDGLKTSLKEEELARIAAEGRIALPEADEDDDDLASQASPIKSPRKVTPVDGDDKENVVPTKRALDIKALQDELVREKRLRERAQEQVDFMKMECQFQCCSCRIAEQQGQRYVHDDSLARQMEEIKKSVPQMLHAVDVLDFVTNVVDSMGEEVSTTLVTTSEPEQQRPRRSEFLINLSSPAKPECDVFFVMNDEDEERMDVQLEEERDASIGTSTTRHDFQSSAEPEEQGDDNDEAEAMQTAPSTPPGEPSTRTKPMSPRTPTSIAVKTVTHTTTVPIQFSPYPSTPRPQGQRALEDALNSQPKTPMTLHHPPTAPVACQHSPFPSKAFRPDGTLDREAALEQIRQRRGRARSIAMGHATPRKQTEEQGLLGRRDISAPVGQTSKAWTRG